MKKSQSGFTLVEIAIVMVIIGLLLGGVLKGQELITNSKIKNAVNDLNGISAAFNAYTDRYRHMAGDDGPLATLTARGGPWLTVTQFGNNDGILTITAAQTFTGAGENDNFWQHLKAAGLITGNPADAGIAALPRNAFGGLTGVTAVGVTGMTGNVVCMSQIPGKAAAAIDNQLDDGLPTTGAIRATTGAVGANTPPGAAAPSYVETAVYTLCRNL
ncbi:MAG TPA: prepilin-type N-terminal cleavage/methylation domain-containing protein [Sulfuricella sp.]|nr:prepilin-type N-terminal cleavage/methylation domain-containing protein [Sulfuricella sp.]